MLCGYARVSTSDQDPDLQLDALGSAGCERIWCERISGAARQRPEWSALEEQLRPGDTVVVWKLDRLGRSLSHLVNTIDALSVRGVGFRSLTEAIDTTSPSGRLVLHMIGAMAEFERELIRERTRAGMVAARERGVRVGRPRSVSEAQLAAARQLVESGTHSISSAAQAVGVSRGAMYRAFERSAEARSKVV